MSFDIALRDNVAGGFDVVLSADAPPEPPAGDGGILFPWLRRRRRVRRR